MNLTITDIMGAEVLRMALDAFVDRQHKLAHTARTGGNLGYYWPKAIDAQMRLQFAEGCNARVRVALGILDQLDRLEADPPMASEYAGHVLGGL